MTTPAEVAAARTQHLEFLWTSIQARPDVLATHRLCEDTADKPLADLLRDHRKRAIESDREIEQRALVDGALQAYSLLTVAVIAGYVPTDFDAARTDRVRHLLDRDAVRAYYETHYKLLLPSLLRLHVTGVATLPHDDDEFAWGCFQWFLRFAGRFEDDPDLATFIDLLDGFRWGTLSIDSFLAGLTHPEDALLGLAKPPGSLRVEDRALLGMFRFFAFCNELAPALEAMDGAPLTQSACYFYYAYWFKEFKEDVGAKVRSGLSVLERWLKSSASMAGTDVAREGHKTVENTRLAVTDLVSGRFAAPLLKRYYGRQHG